jgi:hypothetical protein
VADRTVNEVVIGAKVEICDARGTVIARTATDWCGDFRYDDCERETYRVRIEACGYEPVELEADCTQSDVVFDDIFATR